MKRFLFFSALLCFTSILVAEPVQIKGSNGRVIPFDGIREAVPQGLWLRVKEGGDEVAIPWSKFDLESLKTAHPVIHEAYVKAQAGESTVLELGSYERVVVTFAIDAALEKVSPHTEAKSHPAAEELNLKPYLFNSGGEDHPLPFRFFAPDREFREGDEKIPLIVWLHGAGSGGDDNFKNTNLNLARKLAEQEKEAFLVIPQFNDEYNWWTYVSENGTAKKGVPGRQILDLLDEICEGIPAVDPGRIYIMGMSQGGFGIPYLATAYPNRFAAQVLIAGMTWTVPWSSKNYIPTYLFYSKDDPIMNQNGTDYAAKMITALQAVCGTREIKAMVYEDAGHVGTLGRALDDPGLFDWLFVQKNAETPKRDEAVLSKHFD
ncbi:alpha/beta hydrolase-fold protein [Verrucomicrobiales bacterium]|nr:alpha/beta hydrolase-fold protein [Verrucomicrobiales bacterium]